MGYVYSKENIKQFSKTISFTPELSEDELAYLNEKISGLNPKQAETDVEDAAKHVQLDLREPATQQMLIQAGVPLSSISDMIKEAEAEGVDPIVDFPVIESTLNIPLLDVIKKLFKQKPLVNSDTLIEKLNSGNPLDNDDVRSLLSYMHTLIKDAKKAKNKQEIEQLRTIFKKVYPKELVKTRILKDITILVATLGSLLGVSFFGVKTVNRNKV